MGILKKSTSRNKETKIIPDEDDGTLPYVDAQDDESTGTVVMETVTESTQEADEEGQLSVDVFQTADQIIVVAPVAGVKMSDISITISDDVLTIKGRRPFHFKVEAADYFTQECFWGTFSRSIILPESVDTSKVNASFKNAILTVRVPKVEKIKTRMIKIRQE